MNRFFISVLVVSLFAAAPLETKALDGKRYSDKKLSYENLSKKSMLPTITMFAVDEIVECDGSGNSTQLNAWLLNNGGATANASAGTLRWDYNLISVSTGCGESLTATYEFLAIDDDGSISAGTARFIIQDTTAPMLGMGGGINQTVECDGSGNMGQLNTWLAGNGGFSASDPCSTVLTWSNTLTGTVVDCGGAATMTYQFTVTDECGNSVIAGSANFIIEDTTNPTITCPASTTIECGTDTTPGTLGMAASTDLCSGITSTTFSDVVVVGGSCPITQTITRTWTVTDGCTNTNTCNQVITIEDNTPPVITTFPQDMIVECDSTLILRGSSAKGFMTNLEALNGWLNNGGGAIASDACGAAVFWNVSATASNDLCGGTGEYEYEFTVEDACGNQVSAGRASFFVVDTQGPVITDLPRDTTVACDGIGNVAQLAAWRNSNAGATAREGCSDPSVWSNTLVSTTSGCAGTFANTYEFTVTDACGNATIAGNATFTVIDNVSPTWTTPPTNETVECNGAGNSTALNTWITASTNLANVTDACGLFTISTTLIDFSGGFCLGESVATYQFTATDECGNAASETATFTIDDAVAPNISCPAGAIIHCNVDTSPNTQGFATATDACGLSGNPTYTDVSVPGTCPTIETITRTWSIADDCGNISTCNQVFAIQDALMPTLVAAPQNMTVECDGTGNITALTAWRNNHAGGLASDDCGSLTYSFVENSIPNPLLCSGTGCYNYTFSATDNCSNTLVLGTAEFCIEDKIAPQFSAQALSTTVECNGSGNITELNNWLAANGGATATGGCDGSLNWTATRLNTIDNCGMTLVYQYEFAVADDCGNTSVTNADFTIVDTTAPTWVNAPDIDDEACDGSGNATGLANFLAAWGNLANISESCGTATITPNLIGINIADNCPNLIEYRYEFTATDQCGNMSTNEAFFKIFDLTPPTISCPANSVISCNSIDTPANLGTATATDVCSNTPTITYADVDVPTSACLVNRTRTWTATDDCNNSSTCNQLITISDNVAPVVITAPQNMTVECDGTQIVNNSNTKGSVVTNVAEFAIWRNTAGGAVVNDDCGNGVNFSSNLTNTANTCGGSVAYTYEFFATDDCTNQVSIGSATFTVEDTQGPTVLTIPLDTVVNCAAAAVTAADLATWIANNGGATASDPCSPTLTWTATALSTTPTCSGNTTQLYQFEVEDLCGNKTLAGNASFTIIDNVAPVWNDALPLPGNTTVGCDGNGNTGDLATWLGLWETATNAPDACGTTTITSELSNLTGGTCPIVSVATYIFTASDACGNSDTRSATFTINDTTVPTITCPGAATIACTADSSPNALGFATGTDVCSTLGIPTYVDASVVGTCPTLETITRTWTIADNCGNANTCNQTITVQDNAVPAIVANPQDETVECDGSGNLTERNAWLASNAFAIVTDDCGIVTFSNNLISSPSGCSGTGCYTYSFAAQDGCGNNVNLGTADFCIEDTNAPTITTAATDLNVSCDGSATAAINAWTTLNGNAIAADGCGAITWSFSILTTNPSCVANSVTTVYQFTATDACGNASNTTANLNITDTNAPTWLATVSLPGSETVECNGTGNTGDLTNWLNDWTVASNVSDDCSTVIISTLLTNFAPGTCPGNSVATYEFTATDVCGNASTRTATFTIEDTTMPTISCPANATVECADDYSPGTLGFPSGNDACSNLDSPIFSDVSAAGACPLVATVTRTWTIEDECGNMATCNQIITRQDTEVPTLVLAPQTTFVECDGAGNATELAVWLGDAGDALATDDCGTVTYSAVAGTSTNPCGSTGCTTYTFTATDLCGNRLNMGDAEFCIEDTSIPQISQAAQSVIVECDGGGNAGALATYLAANGNAAATDACDGTLTWSNSVLNTLNTCGGTSATTYQFRATDDCGNVAVTTGTFIIEDTSGPTWVAPQSNIAVECDGNGNTTQLANWIALWETSTNASDICGSVTISSQLFDFQGGTCPIVSVSTYQFTATDVCGNTTTRSATFTINDATIPTITCPAGATIACTDDSSPNALGFATGTDVCSTPGVPTYVDVSVAGTCPTIETITRTWSISDDCGNTNTCNQVIIVQDNAVPVIVANPQNRTVECDGSGNTTEFNNWLTNNGFAIVTDDCGAVNFSNTRTAMPSGCSNTGCYTYSFTAEDGCGNVLNLGSANFCIEDTNAPTITTAATDLNVSCNGSATAAINAWTTLNGNAIAADGCGAITWSFSILTTNPSCVANSVTTVYQFTATDACGNASNTTANLNITDTSAPTWLATVSLPGSETVECNGTGNTGDLTNWLNDWTVASNVSDDCSTVIISTLLTNFAPGTCPGNSVATYEFTATDVCGNASTRTATFTIEDTTMPTISCPANATVECADDYSPGTLGFPSGNDGCSNLDSPIFSDVSAAGACPLVATVTRTWTIEDECGNMATCNQIITRQDTEVPTLVLAPQTTFVECDGAGNATELAVWLGDAGDALATDDCGTVTYSAVAGTSTNPCGSTGCTTYTFTATDLCGNRLNMGDAEFCIEDTSIPQISQAAQSVIVECDGGGNAGALATYLAANGNAAATDACDGTLTWSNSVLNTLNTCGGTSATTYQFRATDDCGNVAVTTGTFIIEDTSGPTWVAPQSNIAVECDGNGNTTQLANWIALWETSTNATDVCGSVTISSQLFDFQGGTCPIVSVSTYQFTATDVCGNTTTRSATFTINDATIPTITCPAGATIACTDDSSPNALGFATGTDVCGITGNPTYADVSVAGTCPTLATVTRTWTIADECGNMNTCNQTIILQDNEVPVIVSLPQNQTVECDGSGNTTEFNTWLSNNGFSIVTDDCGSVTYTPIRTAMPSGCSSTGCYTYSFTAEDGCGNSVNLGSADFCIQDTDGPVITTPASDFNVTCNGSATAAINLWTAANGTAVANDVCGNVTWSFTILTTNPTCVGNAFSTTYEFTATDDCGNATSTTANLNLTDITPPTWALAGALPSDMTVECNGTGNTTELAAWVAAWEAAANVSDDCSSVTISSALRTFTPGTCAGNSMSTYEFTATDVCGNTAVRTGIFTIEDTTIPTISCPAGATVNCSDDFTPGSLGFPTGSDVCSNLNTPSFSDVTVTALPVDCPLLETITRRWTLSDECGNVNTCDQIIVRRDTENPVLVAAPQDLIVECDGAGNATELANWLTDAGDALASDDCSTITYSSSIETAMTDLCGSTGCTTYEFTATDGCGNALVLGQADFCIEDTAVPQITSLAVNEIVECGPTNGTSLTNWLNANGNATATDVCDGTLAWTNAILQTTSGCGNTSTTTYQFTATDDCGNFSVTTADFVIEDTAMPTWSTLPGNETVECDGSGNTTEFNAWFGAWTNAANVADVCGGGTVAINSNLIDNVDNCGGTSVRTYQFTAIDVCGNVNIQTATFTINDTTAPTISCPTSPITIDCSEDASPATRGFATGTDGCGGTTVTYSDVVVLSTVTLLDSITRTWVITDDCNNSNTCTQIIQRRDTENPTIAATPQNRTVECDGAGNTTALSTWIADHADALASDDCSTITYNATLISTTPNPTCTAFNCVRYQFTATDGFGNSVTLGQADFCIEDTTNPQISTPATSLTLDCGDVDLSTNRSAWVNANGNAVASDLCDNSLTWAASILQTTAGCGNTSTTTYQFTATDDCGNFSVTTADLIVQDVTAPVWSLTLGDSNLECDGTGNTAAFNFWFASWTNVANVTETCGSATITSNLINNVDNCGGTSVRTFEFTATDDCGNENIQTATFTINDTTAPTISCPTSPVTVNCNEDYSPTALGFATGSDDCGNVGSPMFTDVIVTGSGTLLETITRTWSISDDCGNISTCNQVIERRDTEIPTIVSTPQDLTIECDGNGNIGAFSTWINDHADAVASDDCSTITYNSTLISTTMSCGSFNCVRYEFTAADAVGNSVTLGQADFCIEDTTNPQLLTSATNLILECGAPDFSVDSLVWVIAHGNSVATDACDLNLTWATSILQTTGGCGNTSTTTYQFTATDDCGNFSVTTADLIVQDVTAPVWSLNPGNASLQCDGANNTNSYNSWLASWTNVANVTETCGSATITSNLLNLVNGCGDTYTRTFEFTATDECGNATVQTATFEIFDMAAPTIICPAGATVDCDLAYGPNELGFATATDLCGNVNSPTYTDAVAIGNCPIVEVITRTWTVTDECSNTSTCNQIINRRDNVAPTELVEPQNMTVECDGSGNNTELIAWRDNHAGALALDDCSTLIYSSSIISFPSGCSSTGCWVFNFTARDACGNVLDFGNAEFCIEDTTSPQITQTAISETVECGSGNAADLTIWLTANGNATANDVCDNNLTWTNRVLTTNNNCGTTSAVTYEFTATDVCGNFSVTTADFVIEDTTAPTWIAAASLPGNIVVECNGAGNTGDLINWVNSWTVATNASDDCNPAGASGGAITSALLGFGNGGCFGASVSTYVFAASDACGNISTQTATFTIEDNTAPSINCPAGRVLVCTDDTAPNALGFATGLDLCSNLPTITYADVDVTNVCQVVKTRTWTATDNCGNTATCNQVIQLNDTAAPTLTRMPTVSNYEYFRDPTGACHSNVRNPQGLNKGNGCWEMIFDLFDAQGNPMGIAEFDGPCAVDDCGMVITPVLSSAKIIDNNCFSVWSVSWRFEDNCGNFVDYDQTFTFVDQAAPLWTQANPILLSANCTDDINTVIAANIPTVEDNCTGAVVTEVNRFTIPGNCGSNFTQVVEYNAVDACGNLNPTLYQVRIDLLDSTAPTWIPTASLPGNQSVECDGTGNQGDLNTWLTNWKVSTNATDICGAVTITEQLLNFFPGQCNGTGIWNYQFTAEDPCGNTSIQNATFTIEDTTGPTISTCPTTTTVDCEDSIDPAVLGQPTATDVCNAVTGFTHSDVSTFPGCPGPLEQITRTWTALDACGNTSTCVQTINVTDGTIPTLLVTSNDQLILLNNVNGACSEESTGAGDPGIHLSSVSADGPFCSQAAFDAYDANGIYVETFIAPGPCAEDNCSAITFGHAVSTAQNGCDFVTTITWTMTDDCGNSITDVQVVTVRDMTPPAWVNQSAITVMVDCGDDINAVIAANAPTATDNCSVNYNVVSDNTVGGNCSSNYTRTITYSVSDDCGNTNPTNVDLIIILDDQTGPAFTVSPKDTTVECNGNNAAAIAIWLSDFADAQFADACGTATITAFPSDTIAQCGGTANYEYSFVVADDCGNADTVTAMFMLIDTTAPVIVTAATDMTLSCELAGGNALNNWLAAGGNAVATDNCLNPVFWENELLSTTANTCLPDTMRYRLMAVDSCGGRDTTEAMFILIDTIAPIIAGVPNDTIIDCNGTVPSAASPTIMDCDANATLTFNQTIVNVNSNGVLDSITRIWTATDCQNLVSRDTQIIIVKPTNAPTLTFCPADIGPIVSQNGQCVTVNWSLPIFSSNCPYTVTSTHNPGDCFPIGTTTVTYTATDDAGQTTICSFNVEVSQFCQPIVHAANTFYIHKFVFNGVESTTGNNGGYVDLTTVSSTVQQGQNIILTLSPGGPSGINVGFGYWRVWIDWNGDGDFYDPSELVIQLSGQGLIITQATIPTSATLGEKRIRVAFHHFGFLDPCDPIADQNGEMEDYTLFVLPQLKSNSGDNTKTAEVETSIEQPESDFGFAATPNGNKVDLKWVANNELETDRFVIERSKDGINFNELMTVENAATNTNDLFYKTKDKNPLAGESFYRLKQILMDDTVIESTIQKVIFGQAEININFFPNPTSGVLNIEMPDLIGQSGRVTVMNQLSQSMMHFDLNSIEKLTQLDLNNLTDGVYFIRVEVGKFEVVEKVFLRR